MSGSFRKEDLDFKIQKNATTLKKEDVTVKPFIWFLTNFNTTLQCYQWHSWSQAGQK